MRREGKSCWSARNTPAVRQEERQEERQRNRIAEIRYTDELLRLDGLVDRIQGYAWLRSAKMLPGARPDTATLKEKAAYLLLEVLFRGEVDGRFEVAVQGGKAAAIREGGGDVID